MRLGLRAVLVLAAFASPLRAQSLYSSAGVGLPLQAVDGRTRALGSIGIGLREPTILPADPAGVARLQLPTGIISVQPSWIDLTQSGSTDHHYARGSRFPLVAVAYPLAQGMVMAEVASVFDQRYRGERSVEIDLAGTPVPATDVFDQEGSIATLSVGYARRVGLRSALGLTFGRYAGVVDRTLTRSFADSTIAAETQPYNSSGSWAYSGYVVTGGVDTDITQQLSVAASATWSTELHANARSGTEGANHSYAVPLQLRVGATAVLTPGLLVSASGERADWSGIRGDLGADSNARSVVLSYGLGVELSQLKLLGKRAPFRLGYRKADLPFAAGTDWATERAFSGGVGLTLNETNGAVLASSDIAVERGRRSGGSFTEDFWRATVSLRISGF
jgi:hypothetical protein